MQLAQGGMNLIGVRHMRGRVRSKVEEHALTFDARQLKMCRDVEHLLTTLTAPQARVLRLHYGLEGFRRMTDREIGQYMFRSSDAVRQLRLRAMKSLRRRIKARSSIQSLFV